VGTVQTLSRSMTLSQNSAEHWDEADFRAVFLQYYARIVAILVRLLGDRAHAEEVANDAFWRLYRQAPLDVSNVGGWLYRTASNLGIDALRASARRRQYEHAAGSSFLMEAEGGIKPGAGAGPLDELLREERCRQVRAALAAIRPVQAQLLILRSSGLSYKELAETLDVKLSGMGTRLIRAEEEFRQQYLALHPNVYSKSVHPNAHQNVHPKKEGL